MSVEPCKARAAIAESAAEWFVRFRDETLSTDERVEFAEWLKKSPVHIEEYLEIARLWGGVPDIPGIDDLDVTPGSDSNVVPLPDDSHRLSYGNSRQSSEDRSTTSHYGLAIAASVFAAAIAIAYLLWPQFALTNQHATGLGEQRSLILADGSLVELNTASSVTVLYDGTTRRVNLESGEALFDVKKSDSRPFEVSSGAATIRVLGTRFNVYRRTTDTTVTVVEGNVSVEAMTSKAAISSSENAGLATDLPKAMKIEIGAGEQAVIDNSQRSIRTSTVSSAERYTAWTERRLIFEQTHLVDILDEFARYNEVEFRLTSDKIATLELTGTFESHDFESFVDYLEFHEDVSVMRDDEMLVIGSVR